MEPKPIKGGGTRIEDASEPWPEIRPCTHPQHEPPNMIVIRPGKQLRHTCPGCGRTVVLRDNRAVL